MAGQTELCNGWRIGAPLAVRTTVRIDLPFVLTYHRAAWTALGDPSRQAIFERLLEQPSAVVDLAHALPLSRPAVSQHLKILKTAGLVAVEPKGPGGSIARIPMGSRHYAMTCRCSGSRRSWD